MTHTNAIILKRSENKWQRIRQIITKAKIVLKTPQRILAIILCPALQAVLPAAIHNPLRISNR